MDQNESENILFIPMMDVLNNVFCHLFLNA